MRLMAMALVALARSRQTTPGVWSRPRRRHFNPATAMPPGRFPTTRWSQIAAAAGPEARSATG